MQASDTAPKEFKSKNKFAYWLFGPLESLHFHSCFMISLLGHYCLCPLFIISAFLVYYQAICFYDLLSISYFVAAKSSHGICYEPNFWLTSFFLTFTGPPTTLKYFLSSALSSFIKTLEKDMLGISDIRFISIFLGIKYWQNLTAKRTWMFNFVRGFQSPISFS